MQHKIGFISLGCAKNLVDSEQIMGLLRDSNFTFVNSPEEADTIIINTCGFIDASKKESIQTILEMSQYGKKLVVVGCLVERYLKQLKKQLPEVDLFIPIHDYPRMDQLLNKLWNEDMIQSKFSYRHRMITTPSYSAYLRISEGCNNRCTYCAIPIIRGGFKSRPFDEIISEAKTLEASGVKELVVISQDTTRYGTDLDDKTSITTLLKELLKLKKIEYIRLLYLYPDEINDELLYLIRDNPRLTPYFDLPIQHASDHVLSKMHRRGNHDFLVDLIENRIRKIIPNAVIRTTIIVGFPGETEEDFDILMDFIQKMQFDHLGAFLYSREEGTVAYGMKNQVHYQTKKRRYEKLMQEQRKICYQKNKAWIGQEMEGLVISVDHDHHRYLLRSGWNAPDDIDGEIHFTAKKDLALGDKVKIKITACYGYDLEGEYIEE